MVGMGSETSPFGCCENLAWMWVHEAWMWVHEKAVTRDDGRPLEPKIIGLGEAHQQVWSCGQIGADGGPRVVRHWRAWVRPSSR